MRMHIVLCVACTFLQMVASTPLDAGVHSTASGAFVVEFDVMFPGAPGEIYDAMTGDISGWWDHSFSKEPVRLYIEAKPGGGFFEIFNAAGDGALHATVIYAERGKMLRFQGPLGLSGRAITNVVTYTYEAVGNDSTRLGLEVHMQGEIDEKTAALVEKVWQHFLIERFKPFVEGMRKR